MDEAQLSWTQPWTPSRATPPTLQLERPWQPFHHLRSPVRCRALILTAEASLAKASLAEAPLAFDSRAWGVHPRRGDRLKVVAHLAAQQLPGVGATAYPPFAQHGNAHPDRLLSSTGASHPSPHRRKCQSRRVCRGPSGSPYLACSGAGTTFHTLKSNANKADKAGSHGVDTIVSS